ncbi:hypothetical protein DFH29DRAFT_983380 [Suillus ampliporus]|nr:hypothetical protein DFH29DRAFT_983380 [Suillus ampliporus]
MTLICLFFDLLVHHGLFPTSPSQPHMAVSLDLLSFYQMLFKRSCDPINALVSALKTYYSRRGFQMTDKKIEVECQLKSLLQWCWDRVAEFKVFLPAPKILSDLQSRPLPQPSYTGINQCPACFGGVLYGKSTDNGGDIHIATDGNFHHCHQRSAGNCPPFYNPTYFLPKDFVDQVGHWIDSQCKRPPKACKLVVPNKAIDLCENTYEAANGKKQKAAMDSFDDTGVMALICRHDIPLFFANIDSPGEQQKYSVALLQHLFLLLPPQATIVTLYDVSCVLAHLYLFPYITSRLRFATMAMHAYGHEWACQLVYNPRICVRLGLSDGEGTERLWSWFVRLIGVERSSSCHCHIWLIDCQAAAIGLEMRGDLGDWIKQRLKRGVNDQGSTELKSQWLHQRESQLLIQAYAPARLRKELDTVLGLQANLDISNRVLQATRVMLVKESHSDDTLEALESLERGHDHLMDKVEVLYSSLNIHNKFLELKGIDLDFVRILLMARDLKINIRKCAITSFFEWDKLDRAVGGAQQALGTKLHQQTRKAIAKRQPALMTAIRKFNSYCEQLDLLYDPDGIRTLLKRDQCREEQVRLGTEADNLCRFFGEELAALEFALRIPECEPFTATLEQRWSNFLWLQSHWSNSLASSLRFATQVKEAVDIAATLSGGSQSTALHWIHTTRLTIPNLDGEDELVSADLDDPPQIGSEQATLADVLEQQMGMLMDDDTKSTDIGYDIKATIVWELPKVLLVDDLRVPVQEQDNNVPNTLVTHIRPPCDGFLHQIFDPKDIKLLCSPTVCLNDVCINSCAALLYSEPKTPTLSCAIFSTHDFPRIRYNAPDDIVWRNVSWTRYWEKDIWVLPIHWPSDSIGHWVICVIHVFNKELHLFDSLAEKKPWKTDIKDIMRLIAQLFAVANKHGHHILTDLLGWVARPLNTQCLQNNSYDCGLWVPAMLTAGLREDDIHCLRRYLCSLTHSLPAVE